MSHFWEDLGAVLEIISYKDNEPEETNNIKYETDLFVCQNLSENLKAIINSIANAGDNSRVIFF